MSLIVAGRFPTFERADRVAQRLYSHQIRKEDVSVFFVTPPGQHAQYPIGGDHYADAAAATSGKGARWGVVAGAVVGLIAGLLAYWAGWRYWLVPLVGAALGAYVGSFSGALGKLEPRSQDGDQPRPLRESGVMLATHVPDTSVDLVTQLMREGGAQGVERADGTWKDGQWTDFDPTALPQEATPEHPASARGA
ncbi:MAG: hypothetical protein WA924_10090 [Burkholderiaceae bacterium]